MKRAKTWKTLRVKDRENILVWAEAREMEWRRHGLEKIADNLALAIRLLRDAARKKKGRR